MRQVLIALDQLANAILAGEQTFPPFGWYQFCQENPTDPSCEINSQ